MGQKKESSILNWLKMKTKHILLWATANTLIPQGVVLKDDIQKKERSEINDLMFHFEKLEKEEWIKLNVSRRKELIKMGAAVGEIKNKKNRENWWKERWFFEKINKLINFWSKWREKKISY